MQEFVSDAVVLAKVGRNDLDHTVSVFTKRYGKIRGKTKSTKKITSKLSGHLEAGNVVKVRFVEKGGVQIVDAMKMEKLNASPRDLENMERILGEGEPDFHIWAALQRPFNWKVILGILGWDPSEASCAICGGEAKNFYIKNQDFFCSPCASKVPPSELIYLE
jgi:recombinational DNA repair protein (RecF pathway)